MEKVESGGWSVESRLATLPANSTSYQTSGLGNAPEMTYKVFAVHDGVNSGELSGSLSSGGPLLAPTNLQMAPVGFALIGLTWQDNAADEDGYVVERTTDGSNWSTLATLAAGTTQYTTAFYADAHNLSYRVSAIRGGVLSEAACVTPAPPAAPTNLQFHALDNDHFSLTWTDNASFR
jgi:hypothetical protein